LIRKYANENFERNLENGAGAALSKITKINFKNMKGLHWFAVLLLYDSAAWLSDNLSGVRAKMIVLETGVSSHWGFDQLYKEFGDGYRTLNWERVANLYTADAIYFSPGDNIMVGRDHVRGVFAHFFESVRKEGQTVAISFEVFQRRIDQNMGCDVGIYTLSSFKDGKEIASDKGKFAFVAVKEKDGKWRFQLNAYNDLPREKK
jgi:uncharacterized protein (TIGR02246 family)